MLSLTTIYAQKTFSEYTERTAFERPLTSGVAYALRVTHSEREEFERLHGWTIRKMQNEDQTLVQDWTTEQLDPAPIKDEYAPVIFSQETVSHIVSIDMMSGKVQTKFLEPTCSLLSLLEFKSFRMIPHSGCHSDRRKKESDH